MDKVIHVKVTEQYFPLVLFIMLCELALIFQTVYQNLVPLKALKKTFLVVMIVSKQLSK